MRAHAGKGLRFFGVVDRTLSRHMVAHACLPSMCMPMEEGRRSCHVAQHDCVACRPLVLFVAQQWLWCGSGWWQWIVCCVCIMWRMPQQQVEWSCWSACSSPIIHSCPASHSMLCKSMQCVTFCMRPLRRLERTVFVSREAC